MMATATAAAATCRRLAFMLLLAGLASGARQLQQEALAQSTSDAQASSTANNSSWVVHECLWASAFASATASVTAAGQGATGAAVATTAAATTGSADAASAQPAAAAATATATGAASSGGTAVATATAGASTAGMCTVNPSYFFALPPPQTDSDKLVLELTAMRYNCVNASSFDACAATDWCSWTEDDAGGSGHCKLSYDDADVTHLLMWSGTGIACNGSLLAQLVACTFKADEGVCAREPGCAWAEGACYAADLVPALTKPRLLEAFKARVHAGDPEVWGSCAGASLYRRYAAVCNHRSADACSADSSCRWIQEYASEVLHNPLNFTKPCVLSASGSRVTAESVFLGGDGPSNFSSSVLATQRQCTQATDAAACTATGSGSIHGNVLSDALSYAASTAPLPPAPAANAGTDSAPPGDNEASAFAAAWAQLASGGGSGGAPGAFPQLGTNGFALPAPPALGGLLPPLGPAAASGKWARRMRAAAPAPKASPRPSPAPKPSSSSCSTVATYRAVASLRKLHVLKPARP